MKWMIVPGSTNDAERPTFISGDHHNEYFRTYVKFDLFIFISIDPPPNDTILIILCFQKFANNGETCDVLDLTYSLRRSRYSEYVNIHTHFLD